MVLGHQQVQGVDYAYTLQGWLEGVNSTALSPVQDMGGDGKAATANSRVGRDAYGFNRNYFTGDYAAIQTGTNPFPGHTAYIGSAYKPLYNGNISSMAVNIGKLNQPQLYNYGYDQLNRIVSMDVYRGLNQDSNSWAGLNVVNDYKERVSYDANGNILQYLRNGFGSTVAMDTLDYHYYAGTNRLSHVTDKVNAGNYAEDIDSQIPETYGYDEIGNLVKDTSSRKMKVTWNVYGKIMGIVQSDPADGETVGITYKYDPNGNRVGKYVHRHLAPFEHHWYVRDAQGNVMAVYKHAYGPSDWSLKPLKLVEHHVYGSSRLGIVRRDVDVTNILNPKKTPVAEDLIGNTYVYTAERGWKLYELTNHLGNVLVTVTDKKNGVPSSGNSSLIDYYTADVVSASDYYPFGMLMPGRKFENNAYRYGFNGQEKSEEIQGTGNSYTAEYWEYDPRLGRRWNMDPILKENESPYSCFSNNPLYFTDPYGLDSEEPKGKVLPEVVIRTTRSRTKEGQIRINGKIPSSGILPTMAADYVKDFRAGPTYTEAKPLIPMKIEYFHKGSKYFEAGWYEADVYSLTRIDWDNGQVMRPLSGMDDLLIDLGFMDHTPVVGSLGGRDWNGFQVDDNGYLTGNLYSGPSMLEARNPLRVVGSASRFLNVLTKLLTASRRSNLSVLNKIQNQKLRNIVNGLVRYNPRGKIGNGSAMDAFRFEQATGTLVNGRSHAIKVLEARTALQGVLKQNLNNFDKRVARELLNDVIQALQGN